MDLQKKLIEYAQLVQETRAAQSLYFSIRSAHNLQQAKSLEKRLDTITKKLLLCNQTKEGQGSIFQNS